jgi:DNA-binding response OmpR family regulator
MTTPSDIIDQLREENRQLRALLVPPVSVPIEWGLTRAQQRVYAALASRSGVVSTEHLLAAIGSDDPIGEENVRAHILRMRAKLKPYRIRITNHWGIGYSLERPS